MVALRVTRHANQGFFQDLGQGGGGGGGKTAICNLVGGHGSLNMHST